MGVNTGPSPLNKGQYKSGLCFIKRLEEKIAGSVWNAARRRWKQECRNAVRRVLTQGWQDFGPIMQRFDQLKFMHGVLMS